ncbi:MAG: histidine phosphatase family protein [Eubacterium sp.]|nr:histidine phosphatase family protein [Eubacterium sp.]
MKIVVIRHAEVDYCWSRKCTSEGFDSDCGEYDKASIKEVMYRIPRIKYQKIYISRLSRSRDTAVKLFPYDNYIETRLINEVPLRSSYDTKKRMPLWYWNASGRLQWFMNSERQVEGRNQTRKRARRFVMMINKENVDSVVITHGFFKLSLLHEMKKAGFRINKSSAKYKNGEYVIAEK